MSGPGKTNTHQRQKTVARRHNLPACRLPLIGREHDLDLLTQVVVEADCHVVTLTGTGGCGKTGLALELAAGGRAG